MFYIGFLILVTIVPASILHIGSDPFNPIKISLTQIIGAILTISWTIKLLKKKEKFVCSTLNIPIFIFWAVNAVSIYFSTDRGKSMSSFFILTTDIILYFIIVNNLRKEELKKVLTGILICGVFIAITGLLEAAQIIYLYPHNFAPKLQRVASAFGSPNFLAGYLLPLLTLVIIFCLYSKHTLVSIFYGVAFLLYFLCLLFTLTRAAILISLISLLIIFVIILKKEKKTSFIKRKNLSYFFFLIIFLCGILIFPLFKSFSIIERCKTVLNSSDESAIQRLFIWKVVTKTIMEKPLTGVGIGMAKPFFTQYLQKFKLSEKDYDIYNIRRIKDSGIEPHNDFLHITVETGILGGISFIFIVILFFRENLKFLSAYNQNYHYVLGLTFAIFVLLFYSLFHFPLHSAFTSTMFWIFLGMSTVFIETNRTDFVPVPIKILLAAMLLSFAVYNIRTYFFHLQAIVLQTYWGILFYFNL